MDENRVGAQAEQQAELADLNEVRRVRREKLAALAQAGNDPFAITKYDRTHLASDIAADFDALEGQQVSIAGRMMSRRIMGKASFAHILDKSAQIQIYVRIDAIGQENYDAFKTMDIGDIVGVRGEVFRTRHGEISVRAEEVTLLCKSLQPLPEKFHGLKNPDLRYRQRYVDLIMNPEVRDVFVARTRILRGIRAFMDAQGYLEVETPVLHTIATGAAAKPFVTHHNALDIPMYMRIETELHLKRLIVGGLERVYEIGRIFRNEGMDQRHNPEFTSIEMYEAYADYTRMMDIAEQLFVTLAKDVRGTTKLTYQGRPIDLTPPWRRLSMVEAVREYTGCDFDTVFGDDAAARALAQKAGVEVSSDFTWGQVLYAVFDECVEEKLVDPTFVFGYPVEVSPLAKRCPEAPHLTERFEFYMNGWEFGNAFSELNDPIDQRERFVKQAMTKMAGEGEAQIDEDYINALEVGLPPTGGMGIGVDRLVMLLTDSPAIRDVLLYPTMRPTSAEIREKKDVPATSASEQIAAEAPAAEAPALEEVPEKIDFSNVEIEPLFADTVDFETFSKSDFRAVKVLACEAVKKSKKLLQFTLDDGTGTQRTILSGIHAYYEPEELVGKTLIAIVNLPPRAMMGLESCGMLLSAAHKESGEDRLHLLMVDDHIPAGAKLY